jgi:hypothetical protein
MIVASRSLRLRPRSLVRLHGFVPTASLRQGLGSEASAVQRYSELREAPQAPTVPLSDPRILERQVSLLFQQLPTRVVASQRDARVAEATAEAAGRLQRLEAYIAHMLLVRRRIRPVDLANPARFAHQLPPLTIVANLEGSTQEPQEQPLSQQRRRIDALGFDSSDADTPAPAGSSGMVAEDKEEGLTKQVSPGDCVLLHPELVVKFQRSALT